MSFRSAREFLEFARWAMSFRFGITIDDVEAELEVSRRSAQRKLAELELLLPDYKTEQDHLDKKRWIFGPAQLAELTKVKPEQLSALDLAEKTLREKSATKEADSIHELSQLVKSILPGRRALTIEMDSSALLEAQGVLARPGPQPILDTGTFEIIGEAIKGGSFLTFFYGKDDGQKEKTLAPYGVLYGNRPYLVGHYEGSNINNIRYFRLDKMSNIAISNQMFERDEGFNLENYAKRSFGVFQNEEEYTDIVWKFSPRAASSAATFRFHPDQVSDHQADGSLLVRFKASGYVEMCWYLYSWGNEVEVLEPADLRNLCELHKHANFPTLP